MDFIVFDKKVGTSIALLISHIRKINFFIFFSFSKKGCLQNKQPFLVLIIFLYQGNDLILIRESVGLMF